MILGNSASKQVRNECEMSDIPDSNSSSHNGVFKAGLGRTELDFSLYFEFKEAISRNISGLCAFCKGGA